jgi:hypothetical protein
LIQVIPPDRCRHPAKPVSAAVFAETLLSSPSQVPGVLDRDQSQPFAVALRLSADCRTGRTDIESGPSETAEESNVLTLNVNGQRHPVDQPPDTPVLWVLRDDLALKGTKYGCGIGVCGVCTFTPMTRPFAPA